VLFYAGFNRILGQRFGALSVLRAALLAAGYNCLLTPFVFPIVRAVAGRLRPAPSEVGL
jgi:hypothetical protein